MDWTNLINDPRFQELASLQALGMLAEPEARELAELMSSLKTESEAAPFLRSLQDTAASIALAEPTVEPRPEVANDLFTRLAAEESLRPFLELPASEGVYRDIGVPGVSVNLLYRDRVNKTNTMIVRMAPGAEYPTHQHLDAEQCLVLEGELQWQHLVYRRGDFVVSAKGSTHPVISTKNGAVLLIIAGRSEFIG